MKVAVAIVLLVAVSVNAHPGKHDRPCNANSSECKCRKLMKPTDTEEKGGLMTAAIAACETELSTTVPTESGNGKKHHHHHHLENMPQEFKDCVRDNLLRALGVMNEAGQIDVTAMQSDLTEKINANKGDEITSTEVQTIVGAVPTCVSENGGDQLKMREFIKCMTSACVAALPTQ